MSAHVASRWTGMVGEQALAMPVGVKERHKRLPNASEFHPASRFTEPATSVAELSQGSTPQLKHLWLALLGYISADIFLLRNY